MSQPLVNDPPGDPRNAAYLAVACDLAYLPEAEGRAAFAEQLGLDAKLISVDNTQAYVGESPAAIVVAFRGSQSPDSLDGLKDWLLTNANNFLLLPDGQAGTDFSAAGVGARFHKGFLAALDEAWAPLVAAVEAAESRGARPLWVTGHSLGGALALLAAWRLQQNFHQVHAVITFGAPMVGNDAAAEAFKREFPGKIFRYVNRLDLVPQLPLVSLLTNAYTHCLTEQLLGAEAAEGEAPGVLRTFAGRAAQGLLDATLADELWGCVKDRIAHHMVASYKQAIADRQGPVA